MDEDQATVTVSYTITLKGEPNITAVDKEGFIRQLAIDQAAAFTPNYDYGIAIEGTVESSLSETVTISDSKPDYTEQ